MDISSLEQQRLALQARIDATKTRLERNKLGQFATPPGLAIQLLSHVQSQPGSNAPIRFLDPAFGTGAFFSALLAMFPLKQIDTAIGYEIDPAYGLGASQLWKQTPLKLSIADFTRLAWPTQDSDKANLLLCNPPYVRHHHLSSDEKARLQQEAEKAIGVRLNGLAGLYCYFILIAHRWLSENGLAGWVIPREFMDTNYGKALKAYLLKQVTLLRVHCFEPSEIQFEEALVSSSIVWFRKSPPASNHMVELTSGGSLIVPKTTHYVRLAQLDEHSKWGKFFIPSTAASNPSPSKFSDLFTIKRGIATGANHFFILTPDQISSYNIPRQFLKPILPNPRFIKSNEVEADEDKNPALDRQTFLLDCHLPEYEVKRSYPSLWAYLEKGIAQGINTRYLCMHRNPWYAQENRPTSALLCTYMGRSKGNSSPFRFILNHSQATAPNVYMMFYAKAHLAAALENHPELLRIIWQKLNALPAEFLTTEGRVYGGGLHKLEPREFGNIPAESILAVLPKSILHQQMSLFDRTPF